MRTVAILACACLAAACASTKSVTPPVPSPGAFVRVPQALAMVRHLADSLGVRGSATYSVLATPDSTTRYALVRSTFDDSAATVIGARLAAVPSAERLPERSYLALDLEITDTVTLHTRRPVSQRPKPQNREELARLLGEAVRGFPEGTRATVWIRVEASGAVSKVRLVEGSGILEYDLAVQRVARLALYTPATFDGIPVGVWVQQEFRVPYRRV